MHGIRRKLRNDTRMMQGSRSLRMPSTLKIWKDDLVHLDLDLSQRNPPLDLLL
jgi:hypothetical protein